MTRRLHPWVRPGDCTSGPQPGTAALLAAVLDVFGQHGAYSLGIYNCRSVRGGSSPSVHGEGRALDVGLPMTAEGAADGHRIVDRILAVAWELGLTYAIYDRTSFSASHPYGRAYTGSHPHYDHLHAEMTWHAATNLTYKSALALLEDRQMRTYAQAVIVPSAAANLWDRPLGAAVAEHLRLGLIGSDESGALRSVSHDGDPSTVSDLAIIVGGQTKFNDGSVPSIRLAGDDRYATAAAVAAFIAQHNDPDAWVRRGNPLR